MWRLFIVPFAMLILAAFVPWDGSESTPKIYTGGLAPESGVLLLQMEGSYVGDRQIGNLSYASVFGDKEKSLAEEDVSAAGVMLFELNRSGAHAREKNVNRSAIPAKEIVAQPSASHLKQTLVQQSGAHVKDKAVNRITHVNENVEAKHVSHHDSNGTFGTAAGLYASHQLDSMRITYEALLKLQATLAIIDSKIMVALCLLALMILLTCIFVEVFCSDRANVDYKMDPRNCWRHFSAGKSPSGAKSSVERPNPMQTAPAAAPSRAGPCDANSSLHFFSRSRPHSATSSLPMPSQPRISDVRNPDSAMMTFAEPQAPLANAGPRGPSTMSKRLSFESRPSYQEALGPDAAFTPVLCQSMIFPRNECCFTIDMDRLELPSGAFELNEKKGLAQLRVKMQTEPSTGRPMACASTNQGMFLGGIVSAAPGSRTPAMEVKTGNHTHFGYLRTVGEMTFVLTCSGQDILHCQIAASSGMLIINSARTPRRLGAALMNEEVTGTERLDITVAPEADVVLIVLCIVGVLVFGSRADHQLRPSGMM